MVEEAEPPLRPPLREASYPSAVPEPPSAPPPPIEWFYMDLDNVQQGPTSDDGLRQLYNMGDIHDFTFVWHEALPAWAPLKDQGVVQGLPGGLHVGHACVHVGACVRQARAFYHVIGKQHLSTFLHIMVAQQYAAQPTARSHFGSAQLGWRTMA